MIDKIDIDKEIGYIGVVSVPTFRRMANKINELIEVINYFPNGYTMLGGCKTYRIKSTIEDTSPNQTEDEFKWMKST